MSDQKLTEAEQQQLLFLVCFEAVVEMFALMRTVGSLMNPPLWLRDYFVRRWPNDAPEMHDFLTKHALQLVSEMASREAV